PRRIQHGGGRLRRHRGRALDLQAERLGQHPRRRRRDRGCGHPVVRLPRGRPVRPRWPWRAERSGVHRMNMKWTTMAVGALLAGCGGAPVRGDFPDPARAHPAGGTYVSLDGLRQYAPGMNKRQLYALLGTPHFGEGMWGVREWNYL